MCKRKFGKSVIFSFLEILIFASSAFLFFLGGVGVQNYYVNILGAVLATSLLAGFILVGKSLKFPPLFYTFSLFMTFFIFNLAWSFSFVRTFRFLMLFIGGWAFWLLFSNLGSKYATLVERLILVLGGVFGFLFIANLIFNFGQVRGLSLFFDSTSVRNHNHIGDFWAVVVTLVVFYLSKTPKKFLLWAFLAAGVFFLAASWSRAAYLASLAGVGYVAWRQNLFKKFNITKLVLAVVFAFLILLVGTQKSIVGSRPYFIQAIIGTLRNPFGVGVGEFEIVSRDPQTHLLGASSYSEYAHNLPLEIFVGMGVFAFIFLYWFVLVLKDMLEAKGKEGLVFRAIFITLAVNFLLDYTYLIPTMNWLWFASLGLAQRRDLK